ncbi:3'-5' exonuclease [Bosea sp. AAP35]|uniref:3'-5' exonuclease n=1 Tax=Bosea sp. AAP35 TaxID=1523417 RepID=UPI0006B92406|nr:3'-5' exonuclease [Bosea sp. AAP35]
MQNIPKGRFVVLDFETTGISPAQGARIIEVSAREVVDGRAGGEFATLVDPGVRVPFEITQITGITTKMLAGAPPSEVAMAGLAAFIGPSAIVAHNAGFDRRFLEYEAGAFLRGAPVRALCTLLLARRVYPGLSSYKLGRLVGEFGITAAGALHRASADTFVTAHLFDRICADARARCASPWVDDDVLHKLQRVRIASAHDWLAAWGKPVGAALGAGPGLPRRDGADILMSAAATG